MTVLDEYLAGHAVNGFLSGPGVGVQGGETKLGNPAFTPGVVASLQGAEACKVILAQGGAHSGRMLALNLLDMEFEEIRL